MHLAKYTRKNTFEKKNKLEKILIEKIIEFELRGLGLLVVHVLLQLVIFMKKQKLLRKIFEWINIYRKNIARGNVPRYPLCRPNHLQSLTPKCKISRMFWALTVS